MCSLALPFLSSSSLRLLMTLTVTKALDGTLWYSMTMHGRGHVIPEMSHATYHVDLTAFI
jgi:hypothetical protein